MDSLYATLTWVHSGRLLGRQTVSWNVLGTQFSLATTITPAVRQAPIEQLALDYSPALYLTASRQSILFSFEGIPRF